MASASDYLEGKIRGVIFRNQAFTTPSTIAFALCTAASDSTYTELPNTNGYSRQQLVPSTVNWSAVSATDGVTKNQTALTWTASGGNWGTVTHIVLLDSATFGAGNMLTHTALSPSRVVNDGDSLTISVDGCSITVS